MRASQIPAVRSDDGSDRRWCSAISDPTSRIIFLRPLSNSDVQKKAQPSSCQHCSFTKSILWPIEILMLQPKLPRKMAEDPTAKEPGRRIYVPRPKEPQITPRDLFGLATRLVGLYFMVRALISLLDFAVRFIPQREL